jgi:hypothetical protein
MAALTLNMFGMAMLYALFCLCNAEKAALLRIMDSVPAAVYHESSFF